MNYEKAKVGFLNGLLGEYASVSERRGILAMQILHQFYPPERRCRCTALLRRAAAYSVQKRAASPYPPKGRKL
jgi:hypothetical protein